MNLDYLTPQKWEVIRQWDYETLMRMREMFSPMDEDE